MQNNPDPQQLLSIGEASEYLGVSIDTLRRWEKKGRIVAFRSPGNHRYFNKNDLDILFGMKYQRDEEEDIPSPPITHTPTTAPVQVEEKTLPVPILDVSPAPQQYQVQTVEIPQPQITQPSITTTSSFQTQTQPANDTNNITIPQIQPLQSINQQPTYADLSSIPQIKPSETGSPQRTTLLETLPNTSPSEEKLSNILNDKSTSKSNWMKYAGIGLVVLTLIDIIFAYIWFNSSGPVSPMP